MYIDTNRKNQSSPFIYYTEEPFFSPTYTFYFSSIDQADGQKIEVILDQKAYLEQLNKTLK